MIAQLPREFQNKENRSAIIYKFTNLIKNKILNYKNTVNLIYVEDKILFKLNTDRCICEHSSFIDPHQKHIITGGLRTVANPTL